MTTLDEFLAAEREQESGGNYKVVNSIGALGAYQILRSNLPSWSLATFGHSISESEFLSHPDEQDAIARHELGPVFAKHGAAGAAAWWYSGQTDPSKTYGNPPVNVYVQDVLAKIGKAGSVTGGQSSSGGDTSAGGGGTTVQQAGLQQAGYAVPVNLTPYGIPLNPFKLPGWLAGKLGGAIGDGSGSLGSGIGSSLVDALGPMILATAGVGLGVGVVLLGLYVTTKPMTDKAHEAVETAALAAV
jgi:hypothetical protein